MHNAKPHRPGSKYNANNAAPVIDTRHYPYIQFPKESPVQPGNQVQYMDEDDNLLTGTVLEDGAYLNQDVIYVRVDFGDCIDAVAAELLTKIFDYAALDAETRIVVQQKTGEIKGLMRRAAQDIIDIGAKLIEVKDKLGHGNFGNWLGAEFGWSHDTAGRYMNVAKNFAQIPHGAEFQAKALYLLSAPSTPDEARQEAIERAGSGEFISHKVAQTIVSTHKPSEPAVTRPPGTSITKAYEQAAQVLEPPVKSTPITYGKPEDDFVDDVPSTDADEPDWLDDALSGKEAEPAELGHTAFTFQVGDRVDMMLGRKGGVVILIDSIRGVYVEFGNSPRFWTQAKDLVLVERATSAPVVAAPAPAAPFAHHLSGTNEWYTPKLYVDAAREVMDGITLDPASCALANKTVKASTYFDIDTDGLSKPWHGKVFLNPPYGWDGNGESNVALWIARLIDEYESKNIKEAILLVNATTERKWFQALWRFPICFTDHRINFYNADGEQKQPTQGNAFIYIGLNVFTFAEIFRQFGTIVRRM